MKNTMKKLASLFIVTALMLGMAISVSAAAKPGSITVKATGSSGKLMGDIKAYRIFDLTYTGAGDQQEGAGYGYKLNPKYATLPAGFAADGDYGSGFAQFLSDNASKYPTPTGEALRMYLTGEEDDSSDLFGFTEYFRSYYSWNNEPEYKHSIPEGQTRDLVKIDIPADKLGYYIILTHTNTGVPVSGEHPNNEITGACLLTSTDRNVAINVKTEIPTIKKSVKHVAETPEAWGVEAEDGWRKDTDAAIGDEVIFKIETKAPVILGYVGYMKYEFKIHDAMQPGLNLKTKSNGDTDFDTIKVEGNGKVLKRDVDYYVYQFDTYSVQGEKNAFTVEFIDFIELTKDWTDRNIIVTYPAILNEKATLTENAASGPTDNGNYNFTKLEYSNHPGIYGKVAYSNVDYAIVHTYKAKIFKYAKLNGDGTTKTPLADAEFSIFKGVGNSGEGINPVQFKKVSDGLYKIVADGTSGAITTAVTPADGYITFLGLDAMVYYIVETKAPDGFNKLVNDDGSDMLLDLGIAPNFFNDFIGGVLYNAPGDNKAIKSNWQKYYSTYGSVFCIGVENMGGIRLPDTGGIGTKIFTVAGAGMMIAAAAIMIARKKTDI